MSYFSRLTDIVTCNLSEILAQEENPEEAIEQIIYEIQEGVAGALRSLKTAGNNADRLKQEIETHTAQGEKLAQQAISAIENDKEDTARELLVRKTEQFDLVAGLQQQLTSANNLVQHLTTTHRALEARLHDAQRKQQELQDGVISTEEEIESSATENQTPESDRDQQIEDELAALKKQLGKE
ncbi:MAG: PspA/IM30 family protein [Planctomycetaceae bacterium]|jgi:phage shock protein A|nr:PspA/IM30 family protein [Planctomycetaceae bacterium]MDC0273482.1 PspA/IM30 family protein [Planctomycetaceae bacterium]MDC0308375.1 PspA/IM30 family protein [Planctomycetaceae bacterium]MDG2390131.1 PspA/IM30 family protein [Planctomycetaceae bacterium]